MQPLDFLMENLGFSKARQFEIARLVCVQNNACRHSLVRHSFLNLQLAFNKCNTCVTICNFSF